VTVAGRRRTRVPPALPNWWAHPEGPQFVGRAEELLALQGAWSSAVSGRRQAVLVLGEAGAGKSRLVAETSVRFSERGAVVLVGCCLPDAPVAYEPFRAPLGHVLASFVGTDSGQELDAVRDLLAAPIGNHGTGPQAKGRARAPEAFDAVVSLLRRASAERPVVLVVEDLHWATPSTMELLGWIVRRTPEANLLLLITSRNTRPDLSDALHGTLTELYRQPGVGALELSGLATDDIARMVTTEAGIDPARAPELAGRLLAQTAGNPFLLQEICRDLRRRGDPGPEGAALHVPETVRELFGARIRQFPDAERRVLELSAVLGDRFTTSLLDAVTDSAVETMPTLDRAIDLGLLVPLPDDEGFGFPHALARQSVLDLTPPARLAAGHGRVADVLEARSGQTLAEVQRLAHHNLRAYGRVAKARHYLIQAAELAAHSWAYAEAAQHYRHAAELSDTATERHWLLMRSADALQSSGDYGAALGVADRVAGEAVDPGTRLVAATLVETEATLLGGNLRAVQLLIDALEQYPSDLSDPSYLRALVGLSRGLGQVLDSPDAVRLYDVALAEARRLGDSRLVAQALAGGLPLAFGRPARTKQSLVAARELSTAARSGDAQLLGASGFFRCLLGLRAGSIEDVTAGVVDYRLAHDLGGHLWFSYWPEVVEYDLRFMRGDFAGAALVATWLRDWVVERNGADAVAHYGVHMFQIHRETGRLGGARDLVTGEESASGCWAPALLALYTELRMALPARRLLDALADEAVLRRNRRTEYMPTALAYLVEAALFLDDPATLRRLRPLVAEHRGLNLVSDQFIALSGAADRYLGMIDAALGDADPIPSFDAAAELARRCGFAVDLALTLTARARHLARIHGPSAPEVIAVVAQARALAGPIGQHRVLRALPGLKAQACGPPAVLEHGLTERELDVLRVLCAGASNREIAQQLSISENTAANHVRSILIKTGSANRTQAAMLAVSRGWIPSA
jgi:DNA-binding CsgD family transcriptional regulator/tetratricopeptide (TPR) repeat protein